jgi:hypothetical protein
MAGTDITPAASNLFTVRKDVNKLDNEMAKTYHHLMAKLLYLCKRARPELQTVISFLMTQVTQPGSPGKWFKKTSVSHPVNNLRAGAFFFGVTLRNFFDSLRVFSLRRFSLRRIFIV